MSLKADKAHVTSLDALASFRSSLIVYLNKAEPLLDDVLDRVRKTAAWLHEDCMKHWRGEIRRRTKDLEEAHQALFSAKMASPVGAPFAQEMAYKKAKRALAEAEEKLRNVKRWTREFDRQVGLPAKQVSGFEQFLATDMTSAVELLGRITGLLAEYAGDRVETSSLHPPAIDSEPQSGTTHPDS